jgi:hypothetical protein
MFDTLQFVVRVRWLRLERNGQVAAAHVRYTSVCTQGSMAGTGKERASRRSACSIHFSLSSGFDGRNWKGTGKSPQRMFDTLQFVVRVRWPELERNGQVAAAHVRYTSVCRQGSMAGTGKERASRRSACSIHFSLSSRFDGSNWKGTGKSPQRMFDTLQFVVKVRWQ